MIFIRVLAVRGDKKLLHGLEQESVVKSKRKEAPKAQRCYGQN